MVDENPNDTVKQIKAERIQNGLFFTFVTAFGLLSGFGLSLGATKKQDSKSYSKGVKQNIHNLHESGAALARRALLKATIYSVSGFSLFCFSVWKLSGAQNFDEFRFKIGTFLPRITSNKQKEGRTEFENLTELWQYLIDEDEKKKK